MLSPKRRSTAPHEGDYFAIVLIKVCRPRLWQHCEGITDGHHEPSTQARVRVHLAARLIETAAPIRSHYAPDMPCLSLRILNA